MAPNEADRCVTERRCGARGGLAEGGRAASGSWFDGISWKGLAVLLAVCLVNAVRRNVNSPALREDFVAWLADIGDATLTGSFVGLPVMLTLVAIVNRRPLQGAASYALPLLAAAVASALGTMALLGYETDWLFIGDSFLDQTPRVGELFMTSWSRYLILSSLFAVVYVYLRRWRDAEAEMRKLETERVQFEQRTLEAQLLRLQSQIEPHFLFNTLAHVKLLYATNGSAGRTMIDNFITYLTGALPQMRRRRSTVAREMALTEAYLAIQVIRMGRRLQPEVSR